MKKLMFTSITQKRKSGEPQDFNVFNKYYPRKCIVILMFNDIVLFSRGPVEIQPKNKSLKISVLKLNSGESNLIQKGMFRLSAV